MVVGTTGTARDEQAGQIVHSATPAPVRGDSAARSGAQIRPGDASPDR